MVNKCGDSVNDMCMLLLIVRGVLRDSASAGVDRCCVGLARRGVMSISCLCTGTLAARPATTIRSPSVTSCQFSRTLIYNKQVNRGALVQFDTKGFIGLTLNLQAQSCALKSSAKQQRPHGCILMAGKSQAHMMQNGWPELKS